MVNVKYLLRDLVDRKFNLQDWINARYYDSNVAFMYKSDLEYVVMKDGLKFLPVCLTEIQEVPKTILYGDLRSDDIVLDLGANVGGFALRAARKAKHVYAVEPLYDQRLKDNIALNGMQDKITIIPYAIGDGSDIKIGYANKPPQIVKTMPFEKILELIGVPVTFLKIDIEGAEWGINPKYFDGIRRIEFEAHSTKVSCMPVNPAVTDYIKEHWVFTETNEFTLRTHIHATKSQSDLYQRVDNLGHN